VKVVISGGGTAGHAYPAIALASALSRRPEAPDLLYVGTAKGIEARLAREAGIRFECVRASGVSRSIKGLLAFLPLAQGAAQALALLARERPDAVAGMGGFVSAPVLWAARRLGIPCVLHEQNAVPGLVNRVFARHARMVCVTFEESASYLKSAPWTVTGNPVREAMLDIPPRSEAAASFGLDPSRPVVLAFGGSRGARRINEAMLAARGLWADPEALQILHVAGRAEFDAVSASMEAAGQVGPAHRLLPYIDDMARAYACASLVLSRAGANTISEVAIAGLPSVLVPYPYATEDHQRLNAQALARAGAARVVADAELTGERIVALVEGLLREPASLRAMGEAAARWGHKDAADRLAREVLAAAGA